ncbi:ATP-dependent 6-phosphofructokinase [Mumia zhuanghuii]|uniref:Pyrophosphate--fructose 6-phosphate 1-phosphotransferase n=2 Tax=Mumia TaxID=1546255 RepID=A0ABW1QIH5_9ACTN|nr:MULTISPECIES: ATP-dependent 6-phosphofructokinase [Mumia]KAA1423499.1 ATP-dependent 6-phosphofructokinase [Mumia zhuanghuii]
MRVGVLTGGGDCPGLNAALRAIVRAAAHAEPLEVIGFRDGWRGPLDGDTRPLGASDVLDVLDRGGTLLGSSRTNPISMDDGIDRVRSGLVAAGCDALIAIGGEDTLGVAHALAEAGVAVVGVPKTIDNDLSATDVTIGHDTAVAIATEAVDRVRTTAESHHRAIVVEVMGRHAGWIALRSGIAGGADAILIPEQPFDIEEVVARCARVTARGRAPIVVVAEGAVPQGGEEVLTRAGTDAFGHVQLGGVGDHVAAEIGRATGVSTRAVVLGHLQRGGTPTAYDRVLGTRFGLHAVDAVRDGAWGSMVALRGDEIVRAPLADGVGKLKTVPPEQYAEALALLD